MHEFFSLFFCIFEVDSLIEAFGTTKQKKALTSRRLNQVGKDTLHQAVAKAASSVIDKKGLEGEVNCLVVLCGGGSGSRSENQ